MRKRFWKNKLLLICLAAILALQSSFSRVLAGGVFEFENLFRPTNDSIEYSAHKVTVERKATVPEEATVIVVHVDAETGTELQTPETASVTPGSYGPYSSMDFEYYNPGALASGSSPSEGNISAGETITITFEYTRIKYSIIYKPNGGNGTEYTDVVSAGLPYRVLDPGSANIARSSYTFDYWAKGSPGGSATYPGAEFTPDGDLVLYAVWTLGM